MTGFLFGGGGSSNLGLINVKDYSAVGDGIADDTAAIQAAVDWQATNQIRGKIWLPRGVYKVTAPINLPSASTQASWSFVGDGPGTDSGTGSNLGGTHIQASFADYVFKNNAVGQQTNICAFRDFSLHNDNPAGGGFFINMTMGCEISGCQINAYRCITGLSGCFTPIIRNNIIFNYGALAAGGWGCCLYSTQFTIENNRFQGHDSAVRCALGGNIIGNSFEGNELAIFWGTDDTGASVNCSGVIMSNQLEANTNGYHLYSPASPTVLISGGAVANPIAADKSGNWGLISSISWSPGSGGVVTVVTDGARPIPTTSTFGLTIQNVIAYNTGNFPVVATHVNSTTFTYPRASDPGSSAISGTWWKTSDYALKLRPGSKSGLSIIGFSTGGPWFEGAVVWETEGDGVVMQGCNIVNVGFTGYTNWNVPNNPTGVTCIGCNNPSFATVFNNLPGQAGGLNTFSAVEGMMFDITDGRKAGPASLTGSDLGTTVIGGGSQHVRVRYNGTNWTCAGF